MNYRMVFNITGKVLRIEAVLMLLPALVSVLYKEWLPAISFGATSAIVFVLGLLLVKLIKPKNSFLFAKEGLVSVAVAWMAVSAFGAVPFVISGDIPSYVDALFETVSGFTTTGASILADVESLSRGALFWRSFTHWVGGMGILVFVLATSAKTTDRSMHILRAEMPGPIVDKFVPKARNTTIILYLIYTVLTVILIGLLMLGGMPFFDSVIHAFGTAGTGGFGMYNDSLASASPYIQWVITIFMLIFGVNFNLYFLILIGKLGSFFKNRELWLYFGLSLCAVTVITLNIYSSFDNFSDAIRASSFQVSSIITTSGFSTVDFNKWPTLSKMMLFVLMFTGGCAGSTAGGFKLSRVMILFKKLGNDLKRVVHPRTATVVKLDGKRLNEDTLNGVSSYFSVYMVIFFVVFILLSFDTGIDPAQAIETNFSATISCLNNVGPGMALVGPSANYGCYSYFSKILLTITMLLGRLEIYPLLLTLNISTWIKK